MVLEVKYDPFYVHPLMLANGSVHTLCDNVFPVLRVPSMVGSPTGNHDGAVFGFRDFTDQLDRHIALLLHVGSDLLCTARLLASSVHKVSVDKDDVVGSVEVDVLLIPVVVRPVGIDPARTLVCWFFG